MINKREMKRTKNTNIENFIVVGTLVRIYRKNLRDPM